MTTDPQIPAEAVVILRSALLSELGVSAALLEQASVSHGKERHPEWFLEPLATLDRHRAVLDVLGWGEPETQEPVSLDLDAHRDVIAEAMHTRLGVERDYMSEEADVEGVGQQRETARRNARIIEEFLEDGGFGDLA